jgi:anti-sigma B factor antagonist
MKFSGCLKAISDNSRQTDCGGQKRIACDSRSLSDWERIKDLAVSKPRPRGLNKNSRCFYYPVWDALPDHEVDGTSVVALDGRVVLGDESQALRQIEESDRHGNKKIILNMDNIEYIDSAGLGILVAAHVSAKLQGAALILSNLGTKFQEILQITKLVTVFQVFNTEAAAVADAALDPR